jgi:hypothetical protein
MRQHVPRPVTAARAFITAIALASAAFDPACTTAAPAPSSGGASASDASASDDASSPRDGGSLLPITTPDAAGGEPCDASSQCPSGLVCMYPLSEGCSATGLCTVLAAASCGGPYCTCRGDTTAACGAFGELPMALPLHGPPCATTGVNDDDGGTDAGGTDGGHD